MAEPKRKKSTSPKSPAKAPKPAGGDAVLYVRISGELDADLDAWVEALKAKHPGFSISKSDLVRDVLIRAVRDRKAPAAGG